MNKLNTTILAPATNNYVSTTSQVRTIIRYSKHSSHGTSLHTAIYHIICNVHSTAKPEFMTQGSLHIQSAPFMASIYFNACHTECNYYSNDTRSRTYTKFINHIIPLHDLWIIIDNICHPVMGFYSHNDWITGSVHLMSPQLQSWG
jgi:hypothetical protein